MINQMIESITGEQWGIIITGILAILGAIITAIVFLIRWGVRYFASVQNEKLNAMRQERELEKVELEAKLKQRDREWEARLDETQTNRESQRLWFSELGESRKEDNARFTLMQDAFRRQEDNHLQQSKETIAAYRGIEANTAATLELLKLHAESDGVMAIRQEKIMKQNDSNYEKLLDLSSSLDAVIVKVDSLASGRNSDTRMLSDIHGALQTIQAWIKNLGLNPKPSFEETAPIPDLVDGASNLKELEKEFSDKQSD